jgi:acetyl-CoA carboxylase biotin carboxyl carrier protein
MKMREKIIKKLIRLVEESDIDVLEVSSWGRKVRITRRMENLPSGNGENPVRQYVTPPKAAHESAQPSPPPETPPQKPQVDEEKLTSIKSPMVGTFYAAPAPDAKPYVDTGQRIEKGQVVCIVEAMKLMNEIESEVSGRVAKICVENAKPVEFGQTLFLIDPSG